MTLYCSQFPFAFVTRVWDAFLLEGWKPVYRAAVALLAAREPELVSGSQAELLTVSGGGSVPRTSEKESSRRSRGAARADRPFR